MEHIYHWNNDWNSGNFNIIKGVILLRFNKVLLYEGKARITENGIHRMYTPDELLDLLNSLTKNKKGDYK